MASAADVTALVNAIIARAETGDLSALIGFGDPTGESIPIDGVGKRPRGQAWGDGKSMQEYTSGLADWILGYASKAMLPVGTILAFNGGSPVPTGWAVCDGTGGTPNLMGRFLRGAVAAGTTGGAATHTHAIDHDHPSFDSGPEPGATSVPGLPNDIEVALNNHVHPINVPALAGTSGSGSTLPPYYDVIFIIRLT